MQKIHKDVIAALNSLRERSLDGGKYTVRRIDYLVYADGVAKGAWALYHYATPILLVADGFVVLNASPYSRTTAAFQKALREHFPRRLEVTGLDRGVSPQTLYNEAIA